MNGTKQSGVTLVELMVAVLVGIIVAFAMVAILVSSNKSNIDTLNITRLNQELRSIMSLMERDIRRAGYSAEAACHVQYKASNPSASGCNGSGAFPVPAGAAPNFAAVLLDASTAGCLLYSYDGGSASAPTEAKDGLVNTSNSERYGIKRRVSGGVGVVERRVTTDANNTCAGDWFSQPLSDSRNVDITNLTFTPSQCLLCTGGGQGIRINTVQIGLSGRWVRDTSVTRTLTETIRLRNDQYLSSGCGASTC